ncbi:MAG TPA: hypothetical protein VFL71_02090 [Actinomycetes bacterium]|nr:hypothetical protein [Actinomycetes bacterium]
MAGRRQADQGHPRHRQVQVDLEDAGRGAGAADAGAPVGGRRVGGVAGGRLT